MPDAFASCGIASVCFDVGGWPPARGSPGAATVDAKAATCGGLKGVVDGDARPRSGRPWRMPGQFEHLGLLYRHPDDYVAGTTAFVRGALAADDPVLVAVPGRNLDLIRDGLGERAGACSSPTWRWRAAIRAGSFRGSCWRSPPPTRDAGSGSSASRSGPAGRRSNTRPAPRTKRLINVAFAGRERRHPVPVRLTAAGRGGGRRRRPHPSGHGGWQPAAGTAPVYGDPLDGAAAKFNRPLPDPPARRGGDERSRATIRWLPCAGSWSAQAVAAGLPDDQMADLTIAVNELTTNTSEHTGGIGMLSVWTEDGTLVCQVNDRGHLRDPLAGRIPPTGGSAARARALPGQPALRSRTHPQPPGCGPRSGCIWHLLAASGTTEGAVGMAEFPPPLQGSDVSGRSSAS